MKRKILFLPLLLLVQTTFAQVGMGTANPRGALDINTPTTNKHGLVLPTNTNPDEISNPQGGNVAIGTLMFDSTEDCVKVYTSNDWSGCLLDGNSKNDFTLDCSTGPVTGTFTQGTPSSGTKTISYSNGKGQQYNAISIQSTGVTGLTASAPAGRLANGDGNIVLTISGTPSSNGIANFAATIGQYTCTFSVAIGQRQLRTIRILSLVPDAWNGNLTDGYYSGTARSKLDNPRNFGPSGTVQVEGFRYRTINVSTSTVQQFRNAIDNADIIWMGYITTGNFSDAKKDVIAQKIAEGKKFFYMGADGGGQGYFPFPWFDNADGSTYRFVNTPTNRNTYTTSTEGPTKGAFGNLAVGAMIKQNRYIGGISRYPASSKTFMETEDGTINGLMNAKGNLVIIGDTNWYLDYEAATDGFGNKSSSCTIDNNSKMFCNIFDIAIKFIYSNN